MFTLNQISNAIYATYLTNKFGFKVRRVSSAEELKKLRIEYAQTLLGKLHISVSVIGKEKLTDKGPYLLVSNHRSVIDPLIIEFALKDSDIFGYWVAKKELYNSFFFGLFTRNAGTILLDRSSSQMNTFFADIKASVANGDSIFIFPEGTRNKSENVMGEFKKGSNIIARKSRLDILPVYIKTNANDILMQSLTQQETDNVIEIEIGDVIPYKKKAIDLEESYKAMFDIS